MRCCGFNRSSVTCCPPRTAFPVNAGAWFCECVSPQHARFAFGQGGDRSSYVEHGYFSVPLRCQCHSPPKQPVAFRVKSRVSACPGPSRLAFPPRAVSLNAAKPLTSSAGSAPGSSRFLLSIHRQLFCLPPNNHRRAPRPLLNSPVRQTRQLAIQLRRPRLVFCCGHRRTRPDKHAIAARPALRLLIVIVDSIPLDLINFPDKQTIAMKVPSADNQVPRFDSLCAVHCTTVPRARPRREKPCGAGLGST